MPMALEGITVLDFSQMLAGPFCAMMLGDLGANVIKIERTKTGDLYRYMAFGNKFMNEQAATTFLAWNRNKRSLAIDIKSSEGKEVVYSIAKKADIVIHNFRPGVMERLGYGYDDLKKINPKIIYASNSGFGPTGPYSERPGQDLLAQGLSGIMSLTGRKNSAPTPLGTGLPDHLSAYNLVYGILGALFYRERTGEGQKIEVDLFRSMLAFEGQELSTILNTDIQCSRPDSGIALPFQDAPYGVYECSDGYISIAMGKFDILAEVLEEPDLLCYNDPQLLYDQRDNIFKLIEGITKSNTKEYWLKKMLEVDLWVAPVNDIQDIQHDPQVEHMKSITTYRHPIMGEIKTVSPAITLSKTPAKIHLPPPMVGQHSREILLELGLTNEEIESLSSKNIITEYD
ncbi:CaiB/BaiF CoA transferase family protein [Clostridium grantii]|uniref:Crotonobetainyl-CoA:carnitine CoA-transferase CaiB n=1 Tax=Clostridium grantii DSM 8605 TaxID=1121316 RepID=A0A1M5WAE4_9CLOT|nr:CoA transferase [Clostridium grantii]SHH84539.1 Crotonobetainyl-CoA:carnitine CoA-transferase CaiB [Clostridium grantii DSM 8605]